MASTHYKLPLDTEVDADIVQWIEKFHRTKKGEMVRHAIRYYMSILEEGETIKFPSNPISTNTAVKVVADKAPTQQDKNRKERVKPNLNMNALK